VLNKQVSARSATWAVSRAEIAKCEAQVAQARASLENAQEDLRKLHDCQPALKDWSFRET